MMLKANSPDSISAVIEEGLCIGCGICTYSGTIAAMRYSKRQAHALPVLTPALANDTSAFAVCPGKGYAIVGDSAALHDPAPYDIDLGHVHASFAAHSNDSEILCNASSGGIMTHLAIWLLESRTVDRVLVTDFEYTSAPRAYGFLAASRVDIMRSQGSKYCPVDFSSALQNIKKNNYTVAILGTPCQIAGIRQIQKNDQTFRNKIVLTVSSFCGGVKNYENLDSLARRHGIAPTAVASFRFRGNGQPGNMSIRDRSGKEALAPYPQYVGKTGFSKHLRCHLCVDATGELADISCGDAWLPRFLESPSPWSVVLVRNEKAAAIIENMVSHRLITLEPISVAEIKQSQHENLTSKKVRQQARRRLYTMFGISAPYFDGGCHDVTGSLRVELRVYLKHKFKFLLERLHLFSTVRSLAHGKTRTSQRADRIVDPEGRKGTLHAQ